MAHSATLELNGSGAGSGFNGLVNIGVKGSDVTQSFLGAQMLM